MLRWVNSQLGRILGWVERVTQQEVNLISAVLYCQMSGILNCFSTIIYMELKTIIVEANVMVGKGNTNEIRGHNKTVASLDLN